MTFINGGYPVKKELDTDMDMDMDMGMEIDIDVDADPKFGMVNTLNKETQIAAAATTPATITPTSVSASSSLNNGIGLNMESAELEQRLFGDDVLDEFLIPNCFQPQTELLDDAGQGAEVKGSTAAAALSGDNLKKNQDTKYAHNDDGMTDHQQKNDAGKPNQGGDEITTSQKVDEHNSNLLPTITNQNSKPQTLSLSDELKMYEKSKEQLMNIEFGLNRESKYIHNSSVGFPYTQTPTILNPDDPEVSTTLLPQEYQDALTRPNSSFPYRLKLEDLPSHSRVETQIKLEISVSPPPPQFLLHIPRDSITKPKFTLAHNELPEEIQDHLLYLDIFVIGSNTNYSEGRVKSCNVCKRCMRRELKRASRRKAGLVDDCSNWDINLPKRAIIINSKEIVSFPAPTGNLNERKLELLSRIVCYCRHHQELDGFRILIFLKNKEGEIVGKVCSTPILIMDRKKSLKSNSATDTNKENISSYINKSDSTSKITINPVKNQISNHITNNVKQPFSETSKLADDGSNKPSVITSIPEKLTNPNALNENMTSSMAVSNINIMNILSSNNSSVTNPAAAAINPNANNNSFKSQLGMFSSLFSFNPSNLLGDENSRNIKRQKRQWSQSESSTYCESINQQRGIQSSNNLDSSSMITTNNKINLSNENNHNNNRIHIKKEAFSPMSSDAISPQAHLLSSATSVFSSTPERKVYDQLSNISPPFDSNNSLPINNYNMNLTESNSELIGLNSNMDKSMESTTRVSNDDTFPSIRRIIPAQGPIRGGIEITLLGSNFRPGLNIKFGSNIALATQCWSDSTIVTYLPPANQAGPVIVTFEDPNGEIPNTNAHQIFTYTDDTDRQLIELALQIVGLKMNGKLEDAKNIAKRIVGNNQIDSPNSSQSTQQVTPQINQQLQLNWMAVTSNKIKELSKTSLNHEEILIKFLNMVKTPNSLISSPNWGVCNTEGQTMLHLACLKNYTKLSQFLVLNGSKIDYKDKSGFSPLHFAFIGGNRSIINFLIKFNANTSLKLDCGILLSDIADPNVLDLIGKSNVRRNSDSSGIYIDDDDDEDADSNEDVTKCKFEEHGSEKGTLDVKLGYCEEDEDFEYDDDYQLVTHKKKRIHLSRHNPRKFTGANVRNEFESEADNEDDDYEEEEGEDDFNSDDFDTSSASMFKNAAVRKISGTAKETNSFGYNLWIAMKEAITNKMNELSEGQNVSYKAKKRERPWKGKKHGREEEEEAVDDMEESDALPKYDDLFPNGSSLRSLINFRGHVSDGEEYGEKTGRTRCVEGTTVATNDNGGEADDCDVDLIAMKVRTSIDSDTKLLFFWLPCMLLLSLIVIGNTFNIITLENFHYFSHILDMIRESVGSFMLGKDRFTNLINENINYGRERMGNLINDVNGAVLTAVAGVAR